MKSWVMWMIASAILVLGMIVFGYDARADHGEGKLDNLHTYNMSSPYSQCVVLLSIVEDGIKMHHRGIPSVDHVIKIWEQRGMTWKSERDEVFYRKHAQNGFDYVKNWLAKRKAAGKKLTVTEVKGYIYDKKQHCNTLPKTGKRLPIQFIKTQSEPIGTTPYSYWGFKNRATQCVNNMDAYVRRCGMSYSRPEGLYSEFQIMQDRITHIKQCSADSVREFYKCLGPAPE